MLMVNSTRWISVLLFLLAVVAGSAAAYAASDTVPNQPVYDFRLGQPALGPGPARPLGSLAPDFTLPTLQSYLPSGQPSTVQTVRLSAFRGKESVVLLFTGHT